MRKWRIMLAEEIRRKYPLMPISLVGEIVRWTNALNKKGGNVSGLCAAYIRHNLTDYDIVSRQYKEGPYYVSLRKRYDSKVNKMLNKYKNSGRKGG